jgi:hypothetical protein
MKRTTQHRVIAVALVVVGAMTVAGCGDGDDDASSSANASTTIETTSTTSPSLPSYSSKAFVVPLTVSVDPSLKSPPIDSPNLLSWDVAAPEAAGEAVRFLVPVELYPPGSLTPEAPPQDYLAYLQGEVDDRAQISDVTEITIDDRPATLMTLTNDDRPESDLHGSLGCPERGADQGEGCFGIQPNLILRLAVVEVDDTTLLAWARVNKDNPDDSFLDMFEEMLSTIQFR